MKISGYSKVWNLGHKAVLQLFDDEVIVEEKIDGSQFSFMKDSNGTLHFRSKGCELHPPITDKLFKAAVEYILSIEHTLPLNTTYRGEILCRPKHNTLGYGRIPRHNIILFDIDLEDQKYVNRIEKAYLANELDLEVVPVLYEGTITDIAHIKFLLNKQSILGGTNIEGIVIKNYNKFDTFGKTLMSKWVSEVFKEKHGTEWKRHNPGKNDILLNLITIYKHENRWLKAIKHLQETGTLEDDPKDIGNLLKEICKDVNSECKDEIKESLFKWAWPKISRGIISGFPEFYKLKLAEKQFQKEK